MKRYKGLDPKALARVARRDRETAELKARIAAALDRSRALERALEGPRTLVTFPGHRFDLSDHTAAGMASMFGNVDAHGDIVEAGAFDAWIAWYQRQPDPLLLLAEHDDTTPQSVLGVGYEVKVNESGLFTGFRLVEEHANRVVTKVRRTDWDGLSIGLFVLDWRDPTWEEKERGARRVVTQGFVREVSLVKFPANTGSRVYATKSETQIVLDRFREAMAGRPARADAADSRELLARIQRVLVRSNDWPRR